MEKGRGDQLEKGDRLVQTAKWDLPGQQLLVLKDQRALKDLQAHRRRPLEVMVHGVVRVLLDNRSLVLEVQQESPVRRALSVHLVRRVFLGQRLPMVLGDRRANRDLRVTTGYLAQWAQKVLEALEASWVNAVCRVTRVLLALLGNLGVWEKLDLRDLLGLRVSKERQENKELRAPLDFLEQPAQLVPLVKKATWECLAQEAIRTARTRW